ncbi:hypothetical protein B0T16DRAFT_241300 [Cercophora newfieldiana]|uniref:Uncharacterized protein n=1 Tax=Cercophora newfieldiana TaxID=92897 RepID=A0AA39XTU6_9PEZI|nr:hypothetical protein B0T16DRAFT_241300 [Cercophora newfieldiana]
MTALAKSESVLLAYKSGCLLFLFAFLVRMSGIDWRSMDGTAHCQGIPPELSLLLAAITDYLGCGLGSEVDCIARRFCCFWERNGKGKAYLLLVVLSGFSFFFSTYDDTCEHMDPCCSGNARMDGWVWERREGCLTDRTERNSLGGSGWDELGWERKG